MAKKTSSAAVRVDRNVEPMVSEALPLKLDLGCGRNKQAGFHGVDTMPFNGVDSVWDLRVSPWRLVNVTYQDTGERVDGDGATTTVGIADKKYADKEWPIIPDDSVDEAFSSHFVEHLTGTERIHFFNELGRVLKKGAKATIITPDWSHACAYGDPTHQWPPMSSWYALYLNKGWRDQNAPHVSYTCDFDWAHGASWDEWLNVRNNETKMFAMARYINSTRDLHVNLVKK